MCDFKNAQESFFNGLIDAIFLSQTTNWEDEIRAE